MSYNFCFLYVRFSIDFLWFRPDTSMAKVPSTYTSTLLGIGLIFLGGVVGSFAFIDAKSKIFPLTRWGKIWICSFIIFITGFSISMFSNFIIGDLGITFISSICLVGRFFYVPYRIEGLIVKYANKKSMEKKSKQWKTKKACIA